MKLFNLHTHTHFCDGSDEPESYVKKAIELGFEFLGFSGHSPLPFENPFAIKPERIDDYGKEIKRLKEKYKDQIEIYLSLEFDYIPGILEDFTVYKNRLGLDYVLGSVHLVTNPEKEGLWFTDGPKYETYDEGLNNLFDGDIKKAVTAFYRQTNEMIVTQKPDIIGHFDKVKMHNKDRYFKEDEKWYQDLIDEVLSLAKENNCILEVNTRGLYKKRSNTFFPGIDILKKIRALNIPVTISSDAHKPDDLPLYFLEAISSLKEIGFKEIMKFKNGKFMSVKI